MQNIVVLVGGVEELSNGGVGISHPVGVVERERVVEDQVLALGTGKVEESAVDVLPVGVGNTVVSTGRLESLLAIVVVTEFTSSGREVILDKLAVTLKWVVDTPGARSC